ncbi:transglutaminase domain-containing protein [Paenibacillus sp. GCM10027627]|uniref:transglutaminase domain-containing protein n=1 Tax=unclassified Paenibacillus TaxID=185978 RepID=UPI003636086C
MKFRKVIAFMLALALFVGLLPVSPASASSTKDKPPFGTVYQDLAPIYNVPANKVFTFKLKLNTKDIWSENRVTELIKVFADREATDQLLAEVTYDKKTNTVTIRPDKSSWGMYPRPGVDSATARTWGGLQKYYIVIALDVKSAKLTQLKTPKRLMFTIGSPVPAPSIQYKANEDGNLTLRWEPIKGASGYKIYSGSRYKMEAFGKSSTSEFVLTKEEFKETTMNTYVSSSYEYAVTAIVNGKESRLSNIIDGEELEPLAIYNVHHDAKTIFGLGDLESYLDLPRTIPVQTRKYLGNGKYVTKDHPVVWNLRDPIDKLEGDDGSYGFYTYEGKILGTTFRTVVHTDRKTTEEEIAAFESSGSTPNVGADDNSDKIKIDTIPDKPANPSTPTDITKSVETTPQPKPPAVGALEKAIADGLMARNTSINLSAYPEAGDSSVLKDTLLKVITQYPLILDEKEFAFDYSKKSLIIKYSSASKDSIVKQQNEIKAKVKSVVASIIKPGMTIEQKEKAIHDWITENGRYQDEVLQEYLDGVDTAKISAKYAAAFNPYGILINGVGVCQSYAEAFKLLADAAGVQSVVMTGKLGSVPHAWNMVQADGKSWFHVDVTNNDGENAIPYAVYNSPDTFLAKDYTFGNEFALDKDIPKFASTSNKYDYYVKQGLFANNETELIALLKQGFTSNQSFYIKVNPSLSDDVIYTRLKEAFEQYASEGTEGIKYGKMFSILGVFYE